MLPARPVAMPPARRGSAGAAVSSGCAGLASLVAAGALWAPFLFDINGGAVRLAMGQVGSLIFIAACLSLLSAVALAARRRRRNLIGGLGALLTGSFIGMLTVQLMTRDDHREIIHLGGAFGPAPQLLVASAIAMMFAGLIGVTRGITS